MNSRQDYIQKLKLKLDEWNAKIDELEVQAKLAEMENREKYEAELSRLKEKRNELKDKIENMSESGEKAFEELRAGAEKAWESLSEAFNNARSQFKK